jgi:hypothetical protein
MNNDQEYNGWSNRETWAIQLHLSNNEGDYDLMRETAREILSEEHTPGTFAFTSAVGAMANYIKEWTEEVFNDVLYAHENGSTNEAGRSFVADVGSWWRADFYEIAEHWIDEAREELASENA